MAPVNSDSIEQVESEPVTDSPAAESLPRRRRRLSPSVLETVRRLQDRKVDWKRWLSTTALSALVHAIVLFVCALVVIQHPDFEELVSSIVRMENGRDDPLVEQVEITPDNLLDEVQESQPVMNVSEVLANSQSPVALNINDLDPTVMIDETSLEGLAKLDFSNETSGRTAAARAAMVKKFGGNSASEAAVASGLKWLAAHQFEDGGWSFDHGAHPDCNGECNQPGTMTECRIAATGLALLAYLGGGHTPTEGNYQRQVKSGLEFLVKSGKLTSGGFDLRGELASNHGHAAFYSHGIATIALCEAYALTHDETLKARAQAAINFILASQDFRSGGWRYQPQEAGDTSVVGWQMMALQSGRNAGLQVPFQSIKMVERYLNSKQSNRGSQYAYLEADQPTPPMTAVGLLCRMYLGWNQREARLRLGVLYLDGQKPSRNNMYYNYYATQVLHHWGGEEWTRWNNVMRDQLIQTQRTEKDGHLAGSWDIADPHGSSGGRLYMTCLAVMTLEVYYRHLPLYQRDKLKVEY
ncbi:hypothetical protein GC163_14070 [bacterium]|nr:hypothetical protein [bacterium]